MGGWQLVASGSMPCAADGVHHTLCRAHLSKGAEDLDEVRREERRVEAVAVAELAVYLVSKGLDKAANGGGPWRLGMRGGSEDGPEA